MAYHIELYQKKNRKDVLKVFESNFPTYFGKEDRDWLIEFLDSPDGPNFVMLDKNKIIGYGGYEISDFYNRAVLTFGMLDSNYHKLGLGKYLLAYRLLHIAQQKELLTDFVIVDTTPSVAKFFEHFGFKQISVWKKGYRSGFDMHLLRYDLTSENVSLLKAIVKSYEK